MGVDSAVVAFGRLQMKTNTRLGECTANMHVQSEAMSTVSKRKGVAVEPGFKIFPPLKCFCLVNNK